MSLLPNQQMDTSPVIVGVGDLAVRRRDLMSTHALGSCIAVCAWDPQTSVGFLLHFMLPDSALDPRRADRQPALFCDTGLERAMADVVRNGANRATLGCKLVGGAAVGTANVANIGKRNLLAARSWLWKAGIPIRAEEVGGTISRTVHFDPSSGRVVIHTPGQKDRTL
ncbi:MAG: chemotaxis protein CheD [Alphaproteobacteria bacterium]|nr:chemotaxis protein CheD [Alphaproteobacteria bacterium]